LAHRQFPKCLYLESPGWSCYDTYMKLTLRSLAKEFWPYYLGGISALLVTNALAASLPLLVKRLMEDLQHHQHTDATHLIGFMLILVTAMFGIRVYSRYCLLGVGRKIEFSLRQNMYRHLLTLPRSYYDVHQTGDLMSRLTNDLTALRMMCGGGVMLLSNVFFAYLTILPVMAWLSWPLTLIAFLLYPPVIFLMRRVSGQVKKQSYQVQETLGDLTACVQENFSGIAVIQSYGKEATESRRFYDKALAYFYANKKLVTLRSLLFLLIAGLSGLSVLAVLTEGGREVIIRTMTLSSFTAFMLYLERLSWPTVSMGWLLSTVQQGLAAQQRINELLTTTTHITDQKANSQYKTLPPGNIEVRHLSFKYDDALVLKDVSFTVKPGETVAVVGPIGSGKSTLLHLLVRAYEPPVGTIKFGGIPIEEIPLATLRKSVTMMPQQSVLFSMTLFNNLAYQNPVDTSKEMVEEAAQTVSLHHDILALPKGYQTFVGERGVTLSGGQRQRSAFARTLLVEPDILLLDDPFSNVDSHTEEAIIEALEARSKKITIFTSHRFRWVEKADKILVLTQDGILESVGTHAELLQSSPTYRNLSRQHHPPEEEEVILV